MASGPLTQALGSPEPDGLPVRHEGHTSGPWTVEPDGQGNLLIASHRAPDPTTQARFTYVAEARRFGAERRAQPLWNWPSIAEETANARVMAAAPDMLAALEAIAEIAWHSEQDGKPPLSNADRWKIVNLYRDVRAKATSHE